MKLTNLTVFASTLGIIAAAAAAQPVRLEFRLIPQTGTPTNPSGTGVVDLPETTPSTPMIKSGSARTQRYELQYRVLDLDPFDSQFVPAGLAEARVNLSISSQTAGRFDRALLSRFERIINRPWTPPSSPDLSGLPTNVAPSSRGLHSPYRGGMSDQNNNELPANGIIFVDRMEIEPLAISQSDQGNVNVGADNAWWYGLYSFTFRAHNEFSGAVTITATTFSEPQSATRFRWFNDGLAIAVQSEVVVPATTHLLIESFCLADFNQSGAASVQDVLDFLTAYFLNDQDADVNESGAVSNQDIFEFLAA